LNQRGVSRRDGANLLQLSRHGSVVSRRAGAANRRMPIIGLPSNQNGKAQLGNLLPNSANASVKSVMGFYIRKAVSVGPFRFNLSKSGIGLSVGVKGLRVGSGPRGNYVHMGRHGLYYRASLSGPGYRRASENPTASLLVPSEPNTNNDLTPVETGNVLDMVPRTGFSIVEQINKKWRFGHCGHGYLGAVWLLPRM
jgi:hypothetical protein